MGPEESNNSEPSKISEEEAATKIQAQWRGHEARKSLKMQDEAATKIQAQWKGHQTRKSMTISKNEKAICNVEQIKEQDSTSDDNYSIENYEVENEKIMQVKEEEA